MPEIEETHHPVTDIPHRNLSDISQEMARLNALTNFIQRTDRFKLGKVLVWDMLKEAHFNSIKVQLRNLDTYKCYMALPIQGKEPNLAVITLTVENVDAWVMLDTGSELTLVS